MRNFEAGGFCDRHEYRAGELLRVKENDLQIDQLYLLMLALKKGVLARAAAKKPTRVTEVNRMDNGLHCVKFEILSDDFAPEVKTQQALVDGYLSEPARLLIGQTTVKAGYFKGHEDGIDSEWRSLMDSVEVAQSLR